MKESNSQNRTILGQSRAPKMQTQKHKPNRAKLSRNQPENDFKTEPFYSGTTKDSPVETALQHLNDMTYRTDCWKELNKQKFRNLAATRFSNKTPVARTRRTRVSRPHTLHHTLQTWKL